MTAGLQALAQPLSIRSITRHAEDALDHDESGRRRRRWITAMLRETYDAGWLPETVARNIVAIRRHPDHGLVVLTLVTGTRIVDQGDRIEVHGDPDHVTIDELVAAVVRRGWTVVSVEGSPAFRAAITARLATLDPPIVVIGDLASEPSLPARGPGP